MNLLPYIEQARAENPKALLEADEVATVLHRAAQLAQAAGYDVGLLLKPYGAGGVGPAGRTSLDILIDIPDQQEYDVFIGADGENHAPGPAVPTWSKLPFKVGVPPSGASMDRVVRPLPIDAPVPQPEPEPPAPVPVPEPVPGLGDLIELLAQIELRNEERHEAVVVRLDRIANGLRKSRPFEGSARFIGKIDGTVGSVEV